MMDMPELRRSAEEDPSLCSNARILERTRSRDIIIIEATLLPCIIMFDFGFVINHLWFISGIVQKRTLISQGLKHSMKISVGFFRKSLSSISL